MKNAWMIRAGRGGRFFKEFEENSIVAVGWNILAPLDQYTDKESIVKAYSQHYENNKPSKTANSVGMIERFVNIKAGDLVVSYDPKSREYLIGRDSGIYEHRKVEGDLYANTRRVEWLGKVHRDKLSENAKRSLMSVLTLFKVKAEIAAEFETLLQEL